MSSPTTTKLSKKQSRTTTLGFVGDSTKKRLSVIGSSDQYLAVTSSQGCNRRSKIAASMSNFLEGNIDKDGDGDGIFSLGNKASEHHTGRSSISECGSVQIDPVKVIRKKSRRKSKSSSSSKTKNDNNENSSNNEDGIKTRCTAVKKSNTGTSSRGKKKYDTSEDNENEDENINNSLTKKLEDVNKKKKNLKRQGATKKRSSRSVASASVSAADDGHDVLSHNHEDKNNSNNNNTDNCETFGEYSLNDEHIDLRKSPDSGKSAKKSGRMLFDRAVQAASRSPGRLRRPNNRSKSPGASRIRSNIIRSSGIREQRSNSPGDSNYCNDTRSKGNSKQLRPKSPGRLKKKIERRESSNGSTKDKNKNRRMKRAQHRASAEGGALGSMLNNDAATKPKRRGSRSVTSEPMRKPEGTKSNDGPPQRKLRSSREGFRPRPFTKPKDVDARKSGINDETSENSFDDEKPSLSLDSLLHESFKNSTSTIPIKESFSNMQDELARYKVKRNKSMVPPGSPALNSNVLENIRPIPNMEDELARQKIKRNKSMIPSASPSLNANVSRDIDKDRDRPPVVRRAESMMLHREAGRRKSTSLANLVQYKEEEIHSTSYYASNHVLINRERMKRGLRPLSRNIAMDNLARKSAEAMAESNGLNSLQTTYVGNVLRGESIRSIHRSTMLQKQGRDRANLLSPFFQDFGVGTSKGEDGMLYMCQLFSERLELALTDTVIEQNAPNSL